MPNMEYSLAVSAIKTNTSRSPDKSHIDSYENSYQQINPSQVLAQKIVEEQKEYEKNQTNNKRMISLNMQTKSKAPFQTTKKETKN